ncbi:MAG TPA: septal ring lytic transglycosylase RlpA family protein [Solirubrobacterales bacterium]|nr:septal ring lytic transglycosylase RlpA family protein [Solirubrobacterales bacterium]
MSKSPQRREATSNPTVALVRERSAFRLRAALLAGALAVVVLAFAPAAQAITGGAASAVSVESSETEAQPVEATTTTAFNEAELSFMPFRFAGASWYGGKSMWGRSTACGQVLRPTTIGVANKTLPCGTPVKFVWHGRSIVAPVIDRGPYVKGRAWDLTAAAAEALEFEGVGRIRYAIAIQYASKGL